METHVEIENDAGDIPATEIGGIIAAREIKVMPVPYVGQERPVIISRPPISEFMISKPA